MDRPIPVENAYGVFKRGDFVCEEGGRPNGVVTYRHEVIREFGGKRELVAWIRVTEFLDNKFIDFQITAALVGDRQLVDTLYEKMEDAHFGYWRARRKGSINEDLKLRLKLLLKEGIIKEILTLGVDEENRYSIALYGEAGDTDGFQKAFDWVASRYELGFGRTH